MATGTHVVYDGSTLLQPLADVVSLPLDQVNFISCHLVSLAMAYPFRVYLAPGHVTPRTRHWVQFLAGVCLTMFCYGKQTWYLIWQSAACVILMRVLKPGVMEKAVFAVSFGYLCLTHIYRQVYDYGGYTLDITGALMINTQRMSSMAFSIVDGLQPDQDKLTPGQRKQAIKEMPSLLSVLSYIFCFHFTILGPFCFYKDYIHFINGINHNRSEREVNVVVIKKLLASAVSMSIAVKIVPIFPITHLNDASFISAGILYKMYYVILATSVTRHRYYFAWKLAEAGNCNAGLGYNGVDERGAPRWDLIPNAKVRNVEFSPNLKVLLDNWNMTTTFWLRHCVYERVPVAKTAMVFVVSALWHGFYPGYYVTFFTGALFTFSARLVRRNVRPFFQSTTSLARLYDVMTFLTTRVAVGYLTFPFVALEWEPTYRTYSAMYWWLHLLSVGVIVVFTFFPLQRSRSSQRSSPRSENSDVIKNGKARDVTSNDVTLHTKAA